MPSSPTANLNLTYPLGTDQVSAGPSDFQQIVQALDAGSTGPVVTRVQSGALSNLPGASTVPLGTLYHATDVGCMFYRNSSTAWTYVPAGQSTPPIGAIMQYGGTSDPADPDGVTRWFVMDGRAISRTTYAACFAKLGTTFGTGDGSTTFNIPNGQGNVMVGKGGSFALGATGGETTHTLSSGEMPVHNHGVTDPGHVHGVSDPGHTHASTRVITNVVGVANVRVDLGSTYNVGYENSAGFASSEAPLVAATTGIGVSSHTTGVSVNNAGSGGSHNNLQPYVVTNHIIRVL